MENVKVDVENAHEKEGSMMLDVAGTKTDIISSHQIVRHISYIQPGHRTTQIFSLTGEYKPVVLCAPFFGAL